MNVNVFNQQSDLIIPSHKVELLVQEAIQCEGRECDEVSVYFISNSEMCDLHSRFFGDASPTDCISFPMDDDDEQGYCILGEVFVCPLTAIEYSDSQNLDAYEEVTLYIVHGLLHLMGYDDIDDEDRGRMREAEKRHLANLRGKSLILFKEESCC